MFNFEHNLRFCSTPTSIYVSFLHFYYEKNIKMTDHLLITKFGTKTKKKQSDRAFRQNEFFLLFFPIR